MATPDEESIDTSVWLPPGEDIVTEARKKRKEITVSESDRGGVQLTTYDNILLLYLHHEHIDLKQYRAGTRFHNLWHWSCLRLRYTRMRFGEVGGDYDLHDWAIKPRQYLEARAAIHDERTRDVVYSVCCEGRKAGRRSGIRSLKLGLDDLVRHFRY